MLCLDEMGRASQVCCLKLLQEQVADFSRKAILKAIASKLIPGIPLPTRISILQQTSDDEPKSTQKKAVPSQFTVLEEVTNHATSINGIQQEIDSKTPNML